MVQYYVRYHQIAHPLLWLMTPILAQPTKPHRVHPQSRGGTSANKGSIGGELLGHGRSRQRYSTFFMLFPTKLPIGNSLLTFCLVENGENLQKCHTSFSFFAWFLSIGTKDQNFQTAVL